jgi:hypothetical protein
MDNEYRILWRWILGYAIVLTLVLWIAQYIPA